MLLGSTTNNGNKLQVTGTADITGSLGIGTITPATPLAIKGSANNTLIEMGNSSINSAFIQSYDRTASLFRPFINYAEYFAWEAGGSEKMRLTSTGLGIGLSPKTILQINAGTGAYPTLGTNVTNSFFVGRNDGLIGMYLGYASDGNGWIQQMRNDSATAANLILQPSGGNVGISTTIPDAPLDVVRGSTGTVATFGIKGLTINPRLRIDVDETNNTVTFNPNYSGATSPSIVFKTQEAERMRITSGGLVNILSDSTNTTFTSSGALAIKNAASEPFISWHSNTGTRLGFIQMQSAGTAYFSLQIAQALAFDTSGAERMRITSGGNLLIGTTTDAGYKLDVNGEGNIQNTLTIRTPSSSTAIALLGRTGDNFSALRFLSNNAATTYATIYSNASDLIFENNGLARLTIASTGAATFSSSLTTGAPTTGTAAAWKLGSRVAAAVALDATQYIEVEVGGTFYKLAIVT
jgi:uncharacterized protein YaiE (UPF0345 family)